MADQISDLQDIPRWYLETFRVVQRVEGKLRDVEADLLSTLEMESLHPKVRAEMQALLDGLHTVKGTLVLTDMTAREVLDGMLREAA